MIVGFISNIKDRAYIIINDRVYKNINYEGL